MDIYPRQAPLLLFGKRTLVAVALIAGLELVGVSGTLVQIVICSIVLALLTARFRWFQ